jgi:hypothetical protein
MQGRNKWIEMLSLYFSPISIRKSFLIQSRTEVGGCGEGMVKKPPTNSHPPTIKFKGEMKGSFLSLFLFSRRVLTVLIFVGL